jgi:tRNA pseudouridine38-40 synthase
MTAKNKQQKNKQRLFADESITLTTSMNHWKLTLSYDGTSFHGWQVQPGLVTVQGTLAGALRSITGKPVIPQGSGRTDSGVHALAQVASFALESSVPAANLLRALNHALPPSIRVLAAEQVDGSFHARHSARGKTYEYRLFQRRADGTASERICPPFLAPYAWDCRWALEFGPMQEAALLLLGTHDFSSFAASDPERGLREKGEDDGPQGPNPVKTLLRSEWVRENELLVYRVTGSGFLHHMVRNIVGTLVDVGRGSLQVEDVPSILAAHDRTAAGPTAPACGLFLHSVEYGPVD